MIDGQPGGMGDNSEVMAEFMRCSLPPVVLDTLQNSGLQPEEVVGALYPDHVAAQVLQNLSQPGTRFHSKQEGFPEHRTDWHPILFRYRDNRLERRYLQWETHYMKWHLVCYSLMLFGLLGSHLTSCNPASQMIKALPSRKGWPCGTRKTVTSAFLLMWLPILCSVLPDPYSFQYRELLCAFHQVSASLLMASFTEQVAVSVTGLKCWFLDPLFSCVIPIMVESLGAKVRIIYHFPLNCVQIGTILWPWFATELASMLPFPSQWFKWLQYILVMVGVPGGLLVLHESTLRKSFESTLHM